MNKLRQYSDDWEQIAYEVKANANWCCSHCHHPHDPSNGYALTVHHIDQNSLNNQPYNLVALCQRCHLHFQHSVIINQLSFFPIPTWKLHYLETIVPLFREAGKHNRPGSSGE